MSSPPPDGRYSKVVAAVANAVGQGIDADLGHTSIVEILRDIADALETGDLARDPYGPRDSRLIDFQAHRALVNGANPQVHLVIADAGMGCSYATWVHSAHGSLLAANLKARALNGLASASRQAGAESASDAIKQLLAADPRHPAVGSTPGKIAGLARELLIDPGTVYIIESHKLDDCQARLAGQQPDDLPPVELVWAEGRAGAFDRLSLRRFADVVHLSSERLLSGELSGGTAIVPLRAIPDLLTALSERWSMP